MSTIFKKYPVLIEGLLYTGNHEEVELHCQYSWKDISITKVKSWGLKMSPHKGEDFWLFLDHWLIKDGDNYYTRSKEDLPKECYQVNSWDKEVTDIVGEGNRCELDRGDGQEDDNNQQIDKVGGGLGVQLMNQFADWFKSRGYLRVVGKANFPTGEEDFDIDVDNMITEFWDYYEKEGL